MHICFQERAYPYSSSGGGAGTYVQTAGRELVRRGHRVSVLTVRQPGQPAFHDDGGVAVYRLAPRACWHGYAARLRTLRPYALLLRALEWDLPFAARLLALHRRAPVDLVENGPLWLGRRVPFALVAHLHGASYTMKRLGGQPVGPADRWQRALELRWLARCDLTLAPSRAVLRATEHERCAPLPNALVLPYPVRLPQIAQQRHRGAESTVRLSSRCFPAFVAQMSDVRVLFAARNDPVKGGDVLLRAIGLLNGRGVRARYDFYGYQAAGAPPNVRAHPFVPRDELLRRTASADICVVPSHWDNSPNTLYEAMAAGKPVVASRAGGIVELVDDGISGLLVPPGDCNALADALQRLIRDAPLRAQMGAAGRARIARIAGLGQNTDARLDAYAEAVEAAGRRVSGRSR